MKKLIVVIFCLWSEVALGKLIVVDGDSLIIDGKDIRLEGIDATEYKQKCYDENNKIYNCGIEAKKALKALVVNGVECVSKKKDRYKRDISVCYSGNININEKMVRDGFAVAYVRYTKDYVEAQKEAELEKRGVWRGRFMHPELFRAIERENKR